MGMELSGLRGERARSSKQYRDGVFHNTHASFSRPTGSGMLREWMFGGQERKPHAPLPVERPHERWSKRSTTSLRATWLGHSTTLLELDGRRVLTDPVFGGNVGPNRLIGPRRFHPVPAELGELPALHAVLVSHDHFDHLCAPTIRRLAALDVPIVTSLGVGAVLERYGIAAARITELDWHESAVVGGVRFTATPAQHFSGRALGGRNKTLWSSWVIESETKKVFFSGDTGLTDEFIATGKTHGPFDLTMLEIGAYHPSWGTIHLGPENAIAAFEMLGGGTLFPVHWGTFSLGFHAWHEPGEELLELAAGKGTRIITPKLGEVFEPSQLAGPTPWWREVPHAARALKAVAPSPSGA